MTVSRVEKQILKASNPFYMMLKDFCHRSKNLYNHANYSIRQSFFNTGSIPSYNELDRLLKNDAAYPDYKNMPTAQAAQQTLRGLSANWKAYFKALMAYAKNPSKFLGKPKPPKYLKPEGYYVLTVTNQNCKLKAGMIRFPKCFNGFELRFKNANRVDFHSFQQVRIFVEATHICVEIVYNIVTLDVKADNGRCVGIDLGVNNLAAVSNTFHERVFLINGKPLKSMNQYYNKRRAEMKSQLERKTGKHSSKRLRRFDAKRNAKVNDYLHKASRQIVNWCVEHDVSRIIIGKNDGWKQEVELGRNLQTRKQNNQNFCFIPHARFIEMLMYKASEYGIVVITTEESYTSGTSFIDDDLPVRVNWNNKRRAKRGEFITNSGMVVNADINAAYQMIRKVIPDFKWDRGCVLHPYACSIK